MVTESVENINKNDTTMSKSKSLDQLENELEKLDELYNQSRNDHTDLSIVYDENHEAIQIEQKKVKDKMSKQYERRKNARNGMKALQPTIKFLKSEIRKVREEIREREQSGPQKLNKVVGA